MYILYMWTGIVSLKKMGGTSLHGCRVAEPEAADELEIHTLHSCHTYLLKKLSAPSHVLVRQKIVSVAIQGEYVP